MDNVLSTGRVRLEDLATRLWGPVAAESIVGSITLADAAIALFYLLLAIAAHTAAAFYVKRRSRSAVPDQLVDWRHHVFAALGKPLYILIWIYGVYFAANPLVMKL